MVLFIAWLDETAFIHLPVPQSLFFVLFRSSAPVSWGQTTCLPVARLTRERLVILLPCAAERESREWEGRGLGRGNSLIDLLCAKPGKHWKDRATLLMTLKASATNPHLSIYLSIYESWICWLSPVHKFFGYQHLSLWVVDIYWGIIMWILWENKNKLTIHFRGSVSKTPYSPYFLVHVTNPHPSWNQYFIRAVCAARGCLRVDLGIISSGLCSWRLRHNFMTTCLALSSSSSCLPKSSDQSGCGQRISEGALECLALGY